jgi:hypothetical protein
MYWGEYLEVKTEQVIETWEKICITRSSITCIIYCIQLGDEVKENDIGEDCRTLGKDEKNRPAFS